MILFTKNPNVKKNWGRGVGVGRDGNRWTDRQAGPNQFVPSASSKLGA